MAARKTNINIYRVCKNGIDYFYSYNITKKGTGETLVSLPDGCVDLLISYQGKGC